MTTTTTGVTSAADLADEFLAMRKAGHTYQEIGDRYGVSYERVRQVLVADGRADAFTRTAARRERVDEIAEITTWLHANGPVARNRVLERFELTTQQLNGLVAEGVPGYLILTARRSVPPTFSPDDIRDALQRAWTELQAVNPTATGLSHVMYERVRRATDPSAALLVGRYGWENACRKYGIPSGETWREKSSYTSRWSDEDILAAVRDYVNYAMTLREKPSYLGYDRWQQEDKNIPSGTLVRNRMRVLGLRTWPDVVETALASV
jgi:Sigma-70, region 4